MKAQLEFVVLSTPPRMSTCNPPVSSIKIIVSAETISEAVNDEIGWTLGDSIPSSSAELLLRMNLMHRFSQKHTPHLDFHDDTAWTLLAEQFSGEYIFQLKSFISDDDLIKEVGLVLQPNGETLLIEFPDRKLYHGCREFSSQIAGWKGGMLFGSFTSATFFRHFWVLDFQLIIFPNARTSPLKISQGYKLAVFSKRIGAVWPGFPREIHFDRQMTSFLCKVDDYKSGAWLLSLVRYDSSTADFLPAISANLIPSNLGAHYIRVLAHLAHPQFLIESNLKSVVISDWFYDNIDATFEVFLTQSRINFESGTTEILHRFTHLLQLDWKYREQSDRVYSRIISYTRYKLILVEVNRMAQMEPQQQPERTSTWFYILHRGGFSNIGVKHRTWGSLPVANSRQLRFAEELGLQTYWVSRIPHLCRVLLIRMNYSLN